MKKSQERDGYHLRERQSKSFIQRYDIDEAELQSLGDDSESYKQKRKHRKSRPREDGSQEQDKDIYDDNVVFDRLPERERELKDLLNSVNHKIKDYKQQFIREQQEYKKKQSHVGENSVPICADVTRFNFDLLIKKQLEVSQKCFDVIMMDPPWKLSSSQPSRGVAIQYDSLNDEYIEQIPVPRLQKDGGVLIIWAINAKYAFTIHLMEKVWGYKVVDSITWVKKTVNGKIAKGHGFYLQHAKETCIVGVKGNIHKSIKKGVAKDVIFSERRGQSQKPTQIYEYIQRLVPNGHYLQVFGRRNNLRNKWVTIGNEI